VKRIVSLIFVFLSFSLSRGNSQEPVSGNTAAKTAIPKPAPNAAPSQEDFGSLALRDNNWQISTVQGPPDDYPTYTLQMVEATWRLGDPIYLFVILPKNHPKPPVILYLYSYPADTDRFMNDDYCAFLAKGGFAAVGFVSALTGQRYHSRPMKEWFVSELPEAVTSSVHDVQMILNYMARRGDVDMTRVGMFGEGSGAAIGILAAAVDPRIKALDLADPWGDWPDWLAKSIVVPDNERPAYVKPEFLKRVAPLDPVNWFGKVKVPVRVQYVSESGITPPVARERIIAAAPPQAKIVPHNDAVKQFQNSKLKFFDWIKDQLKQDGR
jgi:cephalosporin-C deacetylase-like acetyl esterase